MNLEFSGEMWSWKGPAPWHFITVPEEECGALEATSAFVSYGWGMIPVSANRRVGRFGKCVRCPFLLRAIYAGAQVRPVASRVTTAEG